MFSKDFIKGICSGKADPDELLDCGFNWVRTGIAFPFATDERLLEHYQKGKDRLKKLKKLGFKTMVLTPYPKAFEHIGINTATKEGLKQVEDRIALMAEDLKGLVDGWQITNEMNVYFFRAPLTFDQSIDFIAAGLRGIRRVDQDVLLGFNMSEFGDSSEYMTKRLLEHKELFNYMGYDGYYGTWIEGTPDDYVTTIEKIHHLTGKPVIMQEFGFSSTGEVIQQGEFDKYLNSLGYANQQDALEHFDEFMKKIPVRIAEMLQSAPMEPWEDRLTNIEPHLLKKWIGGSEELPHTVQGQADFYEQLLPKLAKCKGLIGAFVFSWKDSGRCFFCHEEDCPCETAWGLKDAHGNPKPAYHIVKKYFNASF